MFICLCLGIQINLKMKRSLKSTFVELLSKCFLVLIVLIASSRTGKAQSTTPVFNHMALCAKNLKQTADFYRNVIELKEIKHPFNDTVHVWLKVGEGLALHIIQGDCSVGRQDIGVHLCFAVPSVDAFIKHLDNMKVPYYNWGKQQNKIQNRVDGVKQIYLQDPDGFWVEINDAKQ